MDIGVIRRIFLRHFFHLDVQSVINVVSMAEVSGECWSGWHGCYFLADAIHNHSAGVIGLETSGVLFWFCFLWFFFYLKVATQLEIGEGRWKRYLIYCVSCNGGAQKLSRGTVVFQMQPFLMYKVYLVLHSVYANLQVQKRRIFFNCQTSFVGEFTLCLWFRSICCIV